MCQYRPYQPDDISQIATIANSAFEFAWSESAFLQSLNKAHIHCDVLLIRQKIIAYILYSLIFDEAEILSIATQKTHQRQGYASLLLAKTLKQLKTGAIGTIFLEVDEHNQKAINFYQKFGFVQVLQRKKYYQNGNNAKIMRFSLLIQ